eukprot:jgi/Tetstr1/457814/TSEL_044359.t1
MAISGTSPLARPRLSEDLTTRDSSPEAARRALLIQEAVDQMDRSSPRRRARIAKRIASLSPGGPLHSLTTPSPSPPLPSDDERMAVDEHNSGAKLGDLVDEDDYMDADVEVL